MVRRIALLTALLAATSIFACSEAADGTLPATNGAPNSVDASTSGDGDSTDDGDGKGDGKKDDKDAAPPPPFDAGTAELVLINEISASEEWVELVNAGTGAVDISGYSLADLAKDGTPKADEAAKFPDGTILSPNAYIVVQAGGDDTTPCPEGGQSYCIHGSWGISNKSGETIFFLSPTGSIVSQAEYPPSAADDGETWGRIASGDPKGSFEKTKPTPGAVNEAAKK